MSLPVRTTPEADTQVREIDGWWRQNRTAAPNLFRQELAESFDLIGSAPDAGRKYLQYRAHIVRRLLLKHTKYHVYYTAMPAAYMVIAVWHAQRGAGPRLDIGKKPDQV